MKEIDFLPESYKSGRRRQISYHTQCVALGGIFVVMMIWNFVAIHSITDVTTKLETLEIERAKAQDVSREFTKIKNQVIELQKRADILKQVDSKINIADILAELSFLFDENTVLNRLEFKAGKFSDVQNLKGRITMAVRPIQVKAGSREEMMVGDVRFRIIINGMAADPGDVARLIIKLEDSPYFQQVVPSFSRNRNMRIGSGIKTDNYQMSEFEISCDLANYEYEES